jgi:phosphatidylserine/phosphatidylglycerophosphate/cardiolipin synthase-like enzyme
VLDFAAVLEELLATRDQPSRRGDEPSDAAVRLASTLIQQAGSDPRKLALALEVGLREACRRVDRASLAVTGLGWLGSGAPSVEQEMLALVRGARREIALCAYSVTAGAMPMLKEMAEVVAQGVSATLVVNAFFEQPMEVQSFLRAAARAQARWRLFDFTSSGPAAELHAKVLVIDRSVALLGSANLSFRGLVANHEMALVVRGPMAEVIASRIDMLTQGQQATRPVNG